MSYLFTAAGIACLDARLAQVGLLDAAMEEAGRAVAAAMFSRWQSGGQGGRQGRVTLLSGAGANGGDALVAARYLLAAGVPVRVLALPPKHPLTQANAARLEAVGGATARLTPETLADALTGADPQGWWVDGLLGTGQAGPLRGELAELAARLNARTAGKVLAVDVPSGQLADEVEVTVGAVRPDATLALCGYKPAHLFGAAAAVMGDLSLATLPLPTAWLEAEAGAQRPSDAELGALLPRRRADAHKGTAGKVWVVGGSAGFEGAPLMAGVGALRAGAGLVTLHSAADLPLLTPELMRTRHPDLAAWLGSVSEGEWPGALALGMGLGGGAPQLAGELLKRSASTPALVLDADALQPQLAGLLAGSSGKEVIFTPHPGEAARMLGCGVAQVVAQPLQAAQELQGKLGGVVVLKGGPTVVAGAGGRLAVSRGGHAGMASAGMGDTLAGVLAALLGMGLGAYDAARVGVRLHARAGERAAWAFGYGLTASDVAAELGGAWKDLRAAADAEQLAPTYLR